MEGLAGKTIVVTRPRDLHTSLPELLSQRGARVVHCPAIRIVFAPRRELACQLGEIGRYTWAVFTSRNAVRSVAWALQGGAFKGRVAAVGKATQREAEGLGLSVALRPRKSTGRCLAAELAPLVGPSDCLLIPRSDKADRAVVEALAETGCTVVAVESYRTVLEGPEAGRELREFLRHGGRADGVLFASPSAVKGLRNVLGERLFGELLRTAAVCVIGPRTEKEVRERGFQVACRADPHTEEGLLAALESYFAPGRPAG